MNRLTRLPRLHQRLYYPAYCRDTRFEKHHDNSIQVDGLCRAMTSSSNSEHEDFYRYSSGRWLWDEETQLLERYKRFDVPELQRIAAKAAHSDKCILMTKLAEGGFNKVFRLVMNDNSVVIARIPNPNAGPPFRTTSSEVATMDFVSLLLIERKGSKLTEFVLQASTILGIPVPKVLEWSADPGNTVGSEFILMEEATGTQLGEIWDDLDIQRKLDIVRDIVNMEEKLLSVSFTLYGNLYFSEDAPPGCKTANVTCNMPKSVRKDIEKRFVIGPVVDRDFWEGERASMNIDRGPWRRPQEYLRAISEREIAWLQRHGNQRSPNVIPARSEAQCSPEAHIALYKKFQAISDFLLPCDQELVKSTLWHWDVHASNIFVRGDRVTSLIDWQGAWAGPLLLQARQPRLVDYNGEFMLRLPPHYDTLTNEEEKERIRSKVAKSILIWAYESDTKKVNTILHRLLHLPQGRTRRDVVKFSANTWDSDILPMRECLIRIQKYWDDICPHRNCPITFSKEELNLHSRDADGWNENADFWDSIQDLVLRDGWTSNENYEEAKELFAQLREAGLKSLSGTEKADFERQTRWAMKTPF